MRQRRWAADMFEPIQGLDLRISQGRKCPDESCRCDLVAFIRTRGEVMLTMAQVYALIDFLAENEHALGKHRGDWQSHGDTYFMRHVAMAVKKGWRVPADILERQRNAIKRRTGA